MKRTFFAFLLIFPPCVFSEFRLQSLPEMDPPTSPLESIMEGYEQGQKIRENAAAQKLMQQQQLTEAAMACRYAYNDYLKNAERVNLHYIMTLDEYCPK